MSSERFYSEVCWHVGFPEHLFNAKSHSHVRADLEESSEAHFSY